MCSVRCCAPLEEQKHFVTRLDLLSFFAPIFRFLPLFEILGNKPSIRDINTVHE